MLPDSKTPEGPIEDRWDNHKFKMKLVNPANKRKFKVIIVGTGLAGASAAARFSLLEPWQHRPCLFPDGKAPLRRTRRIAWHRSTVFHA